jgi:hypothetical protein
VTVRALFKVVIAAAVLSILAASPALAQVGIMGGLNLGTLSVSGETEDLEFRLQPAVAAGAFFGVPFKPFKKTPRIALRIEVLLSGKGVRLAAAGFTESIHVTELEVPVLVAFLAKRGTGTNIRVLAGPAFAGKLGTRNVVNGQHVDQEPLADGEVGLKVGVQFERAKFFYGASYTHGVTNFSRVDDPTVASVDTVKTRTLSAAVGWIFKKGK